MGLLRKFSNRVEYFNPDYRRQVGDFGMRIANLVEYLSSGTDEIVVFCIGTDRATGDSLGPWVGTLLERYNSTFHVMGTLQSPIHALNLGENIEALYHNFESPTVIAIDAALGMSRDVGLATLSTAPLRPGIGVNKKLPAIGDISITGIVNVSGKPGMQLLQNTRLYSVHRLTEFIVASLLYASDLIS
jgi:putative sporulation protein YyaC